MNKEMNEKKHESFFSKKDDKDIYPSIYSCIAAAYRAAFMSRVQRSEWSPVYDRRHVCNVGW